MLSLPTKIVFNNDDPAFSRTPKAIEYTYDATGVKLSKKVNENFNITNTQYAGNYIYENSTLKFFSHPEGYVEPTNTGFDYIYQYKDHLGNVRLSYSDMNKDGVVAPANWTPVFSDGFESASGWDGTGNTWGHPISGFDTNRKRSGTYSGRIDQPTSSPRAVHSMEWVPIDNSEATTYKYSCWAYSSGPKIRLALFMKQAGETGYLTLVDEVWNRYTKNQWVYLEGTVSVPTHIKTINIRLSSTSGQGSIWFDDVKIEKIGESEIVEENNYYPFGLKHKGYNNVVNGTENNYHTYNGKELNEELGLNWLDYGARNYDASLGRFMSPDPYAHIYQSYSPYLYALNNPLRFEDVNGEGPGDRVKKAKSYNGTPYSQKLNTGVINRTSNTAAGLKYLDCSELVYRVLAADGITDGVQLGNTSTLKSYLGNDEKFIKSQSPEVGDIFLWRSSGDGHTGVVTGIVKDEDGKIIKVEITHAKGVKYGTLTEKKSISYFSESTRSGWQGFFRPKVETPDGKINLSGLSADEKVAKIQKAIHDLAAWSERTAAWSERLLKKQEERRKRREERRKRREERRKKREQN